MNLHWQATAALGAAKWITIWRVGGVVILLPKACQGTFITPLLLQVLNQRLAH